MAVRISGLPVAEANIANGGELTTSFMPGCKLHYIYGEICFLFSLHGMLQLHEGRLYTAA